MTPSWACRTCSRLTMSADNVAQNNEFYCKLKRKRSNLVNNMVAHTFDGATFEEVILTPALCSVGQCAM